MELEPNLYHQPSLAKADTSLVDKPSPIATAVFPDCGGDCDEIARCYVSCAQSTGLQINSCFCNLLSWPTACANQCSQPDDRTSIAAWYWDVCPSKMDSELGQIGMTRWANPAVTADSWAIQTPQGSATMTGYNCYYCSRCSGVEDTGSIQPTSSSSSSGSPQQSNPNQGLLVKILVPICVFILLLAMMILIMRYHLRNHPQNRGNDEQLANLLQVIMDLLDQQPPPAAQQAHQNNAMILEIRRANESIADMRTWVTDIVGRLNQQQPAGGNANQVQDNELREALREYLTCPICSEIFHNPVTAISDATRQGTGCLHSFCGGCAKRLVSNGLGLVRCPMCRGELRSFNDDRLLRRICEEYLEKYPEDRMDEATIAALDALYVPGQGIRWNR